MARSRKLGDVHAHGCVQCGRRYEDACETPKVNAACLTCQVGATVPVWDQDRRPVACCARDSRLLTDADTLARYSLGGPGPWYLCRTCSRTHPFKPQEKEQA